MPFSFQQFRFRKQSDGGYVVFNKHRLKLGYVWLSSGHEWVATLGEAHPNTGGFRSRAQAAAALTAAEGTDGDV